MGSLPNIIAHEHNRLHFLLTLPANKFKLLFCCSRAELISVISVFTSRRTNINPISWKNNPVIDTLRIKTIIRFKSLGLVSPTDTGNTRKPALRRTLNKIKPKPKVAFGPNSIGLYAESTLLADIDSFTRLELTEYDPQSESLMDRTGHESQ